jgi:hypothetical protein
VLTLTLRAHTPAGGAERVSKILSAGGVGGGSGSGGSAAGSAVAAGEGRDVLAIIY